MLSKEPSQLPDKVQVVLSRLSPPQDFSCALKTSYKPNATIPYLWLVATKTNLLLCNTHNTRGLYKSYLWNEISELLYKRDNLGSNLIKIIFTDIDGLDLLLPVDSQVTQDEIKVFLSHIPKLPN
jgi:hypothetical protein